MNKKNIIIAEVGLNHMGSEDYAMQMVKKLIHTKIDAISFQIREPDFYKKRPKLLLNKKFYLKIRNFIKKYNKSFGIALCDIKKIDFFDEIKVDFFKVINSDINNYSLINNMLNSNVKKIYLSTGLSDLNEIKNCLSNIDNNYSKKISLVHTQLDHAVEAVSLKSIDYLKSIFKLPVSFGLHCKYKEVLFLSLNYYPDAILFYIKGNDYEAHLDEEHAIRIDSVESLVEKLKKLPNAIGKLEKIKPNNPLKIA